MRMCYIHGNNVNMYTVVNTEIVVLEGWPKIAGVGGGAGGVYAHTNWNKAKLNLRYKNNRNKYKSHKLISHKTLMPEIIVTIKRHNFKPIKIQQKQNNNKQHHTSILSTNIRVELKYRCSVMLSFYIHVLQYYSFFNKHSCQGYIFDVVFCIIMCFNSIHSSIRLDIKAKALMLSLHIFVRHNTIPSYIKIAI